MKGYAQQPGNPARAAELQGFTLSQLARICEAILKRPMPLLAAELLLDDMHRFHVRRAQREARDAA